MLRDKEKQIPGHLGQEIRPFEIYDGKIDRRTLAECLEVSPGSKKRLFNGNRENPRGREGDSPWGPPLLINVHR